MMEEQLVETIGNLGFPIAVAAWLLFERSKTLKELTKAVNNLTDLIRERLK